MHEGALLHRRPPTTPGPRAGTRAAPEGIGSAAEAATCTCVRAPRPGCGSTAGSPRREANHWAAEVVKSMVAAGIPDRQRALLEQGGEADHSFTLTGVARFRGSVFRCRGRHRGGSTGVVSQEVPVARRAWPAGRARRGTGGARVPDSSLTAGPVGSGKSTTMAAIVDRIITAAARGARRHDRGIRSRSFTGIGRALITQRQVGSDTASFHDALAAVGAAFRSGCGDDRRDSRPGHRRWRRSGVSGDRTPGAGHHTRPLGASRADPHGRDVPGFPASSGQDPAFGVAGGESTASGWYPRADGRGRVVAVEQLAPTPAARNLIREDKLHQLFAVLDAGAAVAPACRSTKR